MHDEDRMEHTSSPAGEWEPLRKGAVVVACIPAYNEEKTIAKVVLQTGRFVDKVIVCDDGSTDMTAEIAERVGARVVHHRQNEGYGAALKSAFLEALAFDPAVVVSLDADGQHDPREIPSLVEPILKSQADVVIGSRFVEGGNGASGYRKAGIESVNRMASGVAGVDVSDTQSGFRAYSGRAISSIAPMMLEQGMGASLSILMKAKKEGFKIVEVPSLIEYNTGGKTSKKNPISHGAGLVMSMIRLVTEGRPILYIGVPGMASFLVGLAAFFQVVVIFNSTRQLAVGTALLAIAAILVGLVLGSLALFLNALNRKFRELEIRRTD